MKVVFLLLILIVLTIEEVVIDIYICINQFIKTLGFTDTLEKAKKEPNMIATLMVITSAVDCEKCDNALLIYEQFTQDIDGMFSTYLLDCKDVDREEKQILPHCDADNFEMLPALAFLTPSRNESSNDHEIQIFKGELSMRALMESVEQFAPINSLILQDLEYFDSIFLKDLTYATKVILLKPDKKIPLWWRALTAYYKNRLDFGEIDMDDNFLPTKKYKLPAKFPNLLILSYNHDQKKYSQLLYNGTLQYQNVRDFLEQYAEKEEIKKFNNIYNQDSSSWGKIEEITYKQIKRIINLEDQWALVDLTVNSSSHPQFSPFKDKFKGIAKFFKIDCTLEECQQLMETEYKVKSFPGLLIYPFQKKDVIKPIIVRSKDTFESVCELMFESVNSQTKAFNDYKFETFQLFNILEKTIANGYIPVVWFYKSDDYYTNLVGATVHQMPRYMKHLKFFFQQDPDEQIQSEWNITIYPYIVSFAEVNLDTGRHKSFFYDKKFKIDKLFTYLNTLSLENEKTQIKDVAEAGTQEQFEELCVLQQKLCVIAFLDTMKEGKFKQDTEALKNARVHFKDKDVSWLWIDARCHPSLLKMMSLSVDTLSYLILYQPSNSKYLRMEEEFNIKKTIAFLDFGFEKKSKKKFKSFPDLFELEYRDCEKQRDILRKQYKEEKEKKQKDRKIKSKKDGDL